MLRRKFIEQGCKMCLALSAGTMLVSFLEGCSTIPVLKMTSTNRTIAVPIEQFALNPYVIVRPLDYSYDVAVLQKNQTEYQALIMRCTHADNAVRFNGEEFKCNLHGSVFGKNGNVEKGPAEKPLVALKTELNNQKVIINLI